MGAVWHVAFAVPDIKQSMNELSTAFGVEWRPVHRTEVVLEDEHGTKQDVSCTFTFSVGSPFAFEMWQAIPGTPLATPQHSILHHIGYWVDDLAAESERLASHGWPCFVSGRSIAIHRGPGGLMLEPCDISRDRPFLRDLFPSGTPHFGIPDASGALDPQP
jgi:hypothetical protein